MQKTKYEILGVSENAEMNEIDVQYGKLRKKYQNEMFEEGEKGADAAKKLTELENAYAEIKAERETLSKDEQMQEENNYENVESAIKDKDLDKAQKLLDDYAIRDAEWHYLQSIVYYRKNWINESKKQLEIAISLDKDNARYKRAYDKMLEKMANSQNEFKSGNAGGYNNNQSGNTQMGATDGCGGCMDCLAAYCCTSLCCNSCCR